MKQYPKKYDLLELSLIAKLRNKGFSTERSKNNDSRGGVFPFAPIKRKRNTSTFDFIEVQFDKNGKNRFVINFATWHEHTYTTFWGKVSNTETSSASELPKYYRIYKSRLFRKWFELPKENEIGKFTALMSSLGDSLDNWFMGGELPKNSQLIDLTDKK